MSAARTRSRRTTPSTSAIERTNGLRGLAVRATRELPGGARAEELHRARQAVAQRHLGPPAEDLAGAADVDHAAALLAALRRPVTDLGAAAGHLEHHRSQLVHVGLAPGTDVHRPGGVALERQQAHAGDVADVDVGAGLPAIAV